MYFYQGMFCDRGLLLPSMDSAYLASTAEDSACRVWDITKGESIAQLQREKVQHHFSLKVFSTALCLHGGF